MEVLITGAQGAIGRHVRRGLHDLGYRLRLLDVRPPANDDPGSWHVGDVCDPDLLDVAMAGVQAVVHLAGSLAEDSFDAVLHSNIVGTYQVFDAARRANVTRVIYASSNHAVGLVPRQEMIGVDVLPHPDSIYGVSKVFGESVGQLFHERHGMRVASVRIGSFRQLPQTFRHLSTWLSPGDAVRLLHACLTAPDLRHAVLYGISANTRRWWDLAPGHELGYFPLDDAERYAAIIPVTADIADPGAIENANVGGRLP